MQVGSRVTAALAVLAMSACSSGPAGSGGSSGANSSSSSGSGSSSGAGSTVSSGSSGGATSSPTGTSSASSSSAVASSSSGGTTGASSGGLTDAQVCDAACTQVTTTCGIDDTLAACESACARSTPAINCLRSSASDCNSIALCHYYLSAAVFCPGGSAQPTGAATCKATAACTGACSGQAGTCYCACWAAMSASVAWQDWAIDACAVANCTPECFTAGDTALGCDSCVAASCATQVAACNRS